MSDDAKDSTQDPPGSTAGDAAHSTRIPRLDDKGRPRVTSSKAGSTKTVDRAEAESTDDTTSKAAKSSNGSSTKKSGSVLSSAEYSRTTSGSPSSTSVIPAVKDEPKPAESKPAEEVAPAPASVGRAATLRLTHVEPWSVTRMAFAISVAMMVVGVVATTIFWLVLDITGVWDELSGSVTSVLSDDSGAFDVTDYLGFGRVVGLSLVLSAINVVVMTVLATIAAHLYNLAAHVLGGFEVTFSNDK